MRKLSRHVVASSMIVYTAINPLKFTEVTYVFTGSFSYTDAEYTDLAKPDL